MAWDFTIETNGYRAEIERLKMALEDRMKSDLRDLETRLAALEADPPSMNESPSVFGYKLLMIARLMLDMMQKSQRDMNGSTAEK